MNLTSETLVGYLRAEFQKAGRIRVGLFVVQLLATLPAAIAVVTPDQQKVIHYGLAIAAVLLLAVWWLLNKFYAASRSAAHAARRGALLLGGLSEPLSTSEAQSLRDRFTVSPERARACENPQYYATKEPHGPARLAEMLEESALYSERLHRISGQVMSAILAGFSILILIIALISIPVVEHDTGLLIARVILATMVFVLSADVFGAWRQHRSAADEIKQIRNRLMAADRGGYPMADVWLAFADYNSAVEHCPESVPFVYSINRKKLDQRWKSYQADRAASRVERQAGAL